MNMLTRCAGDETSCPTLSCWTVRVAISLQPRRIKFSSSVLQQANCYGKHDTQGVSNGSVPYASNKKSLAVSSVLSQAELFEEEFTFQFQSSFVRI
jgi:hypothetical protein